MSLTLLTIMNSLGPPACSEEWTVFTGDQIGSLFAAWVLEGYKISERPLSEFHDRSGIQLPCCRTFRTLTSARVDRQACHGQLHCLILNDCRHGARRGLPIGGVSHW